MMTAQVISRDRMRSILDKTLKPPRAIPITHIQISVKYKGDGRMKTNLKRCGQNDVYLAQVAVLEFQTVVTVEFSHA